MGKLGKPQKTKKHKKLKKTFDPDSDKQVDLPIGGKRSKLHNLPVNDADIDRQEIPRKVRDMIRSRTDLKTTMNPKNKFKNKKKFQKAAEATFKMERGISKPMKPIPRFVQGKFEKDKNFIRRVELETQRVILRAQLEEKYEIELPDNGPNNTPNTMVKKKPSEKKREKDKERKKKKVQAKKEKKQSRAGDFSTLKDEVSFGEVAMAPPSLTAKPRKANTDGETSRPGKRSLLLKDMMDGSDKTDTSTSSQHSDSIIKNNIKSQAQRQAGQTVKRKFLSPVQRQITDFQRQKAIDLYRKMKDEKLKQSK